MVEVTPSGFSSLGYKFFIVFAATNLCLLTPGTSLDSFCCAWPKVNWPIVVYFFFPETQKRSLEDIDAVFLAATSSLDVPGVSRRLPQISILELNHAGAEPK